MTREGRISAADRRNRLARFFLIGALLAFFTLCLPDGGLAALAASEPTIRTTLTDGAVQKGSRKTFDVWARDGEGNTIASSVTLNGETVSPTWDDSDKTSFTLLFTREGRNTVTVRAASGGQTASVTYQLFYQKTEEGEIIGQAVWSVELFTIGCGYLVEPVEMDIREGENAAEQLLCLLHGCGYVGYYGGTPQKSFYLAYVGDGAQTRKKYNGYTNSQNAYGAPPSPRTLDPNPRVPAVLDGTLRELVETHQLEYYDPEDYRNSSKGFLGEFVICNGSGWTYSVNHVFPNVSFSDTYLSDGDVVRVQFTLSYGHGIGGGSASGGTPGVGGGTGSYYTIANKDRLTALLAQALRSPAGSTSGVRNACRTAEEAAMSLDASQSRVDAAYAALRAALDKAAVSSSAAGPSRTAVPSASSGRTTAGPATGDSPTSDETGRTGNSSPSGGNGEESRYSGEGQESESGGTGGETQKSGGGTALSASSAASTGSLRPTSGRSGGPGWIFWLVGGLLVCAAAPAALYILHARRSRLGP